MKIYILDYKNVIKLSFNLIYLIHLPKCITNKPISLIFDSIVFIIRVILSSIYNCTEAI